MDKINALYGARNYEGAIALYNSFGEGDKKNQTILRFTPIRSLSQPAGAQALEKFNEAFAKQKKAVSAERIAEIYAKKAKKDKKFLDDAASAYIEAGLFHKKEASSSRSDGDFQLAKFQIGEKYNFNERAKSTPRPRRM